MEHILENTADSIWAINSKYQIIYLNTSFSNDFKKTFGAQLEKDSCILDFLPSEIKYIWKKRYDRALNGNNFSFEEDFYDINHKLTFVKVTFSPIYDHNNLVIGVTCFGRDITTEKNNELELVKNKKLLHACLESQKDTILLAIDKNYKYLFFNSAHYQGMVKSYNISVEEGMNILECITNKEDRIVAQQNYDRALDGESHSNIRVYGDNNKAYYESFFNPIIDEKGEIIGATAMARDVTQRIKQKDKIEESEQSLKRANNAKDLLFSIISHDLRSPIASVSSLAELIEENIDIKDQKKIITAIRDETTKLLTLTEDLLIWAKSQNKGITYSPSNFNLSALINNILNNLDKRIQDKKLYIKNDYPVKYMVTADKEMLSTIIRNILSNAIKFSFPNGNIDIHLERRVISNQETISITIKDNGTGMEDIFVKDILEINTCNTAPGTLNEKGTGIGLIICKSLIEYHKGILSINSVPNQGTSVSITIPQFQS